MDNVTLAQAQKATAALTDGRFAAALKTAKAALKSAPKDAYLANLAGLALVQMGTLQPAVPYFLTAWRADPTMAEAPRNLAQSLIMLGQSDKASEVLEKALITWPGDVDLHYLAASAHHSAAKFTEAIKAANQGLETAPESAALCTLRALSLEQLGDCLQAEQDFQRAVRLDANDPETRRAYAQFLAFHAQVDAAFDHVVAGLAAAPDHEGLLLQKASLHQATGETDKAIACYQTILEQQSEHPLALNGLALLAGADMAAPLQKSIAKVARQATTSRENKLLLGFAQAHLAKLTEQADADRVMTKANAAAAKTLRYDANAARAAQDHLMALFVAGGVSPHSKANTPAPIFVVGLIRSGTTLIEQILAQHPDVAGLGELTRATHLADTQATQGVDGQKFAQDYRAALPPVADGTSYFVDKMPDNFKVAGYLLTAFPNATLIEMRRDPRDVALSMWSSFFPTLVHSYANAMADIAEHMNQYAATMSQWRALFPDRIHGVAYEGLVADVDTSSRRIAALCGLEWHPDMAHPERNGSSVLTASVAQVRQTVHGKSVGKWRTQGTLLEPLLDALDPALWPDIKAT